MYLDDDNNGARDVAESGIPNVPVTLTGTDIYGQTVTLNGSTDGTGRYTFSNLRPGTYAVTENDSAVVPAPYLDGKDTPGSAGGVRSGATPKFDQLSGIVLTQNTAATDYNFGELRRPRWRVPSSSTRTAMPRAMSRKRASVARRSRSAALTTSAKP